MMGRLLQLRDDGDTVRLLDGVTLYWSLYWSSTVCHSEWGSAFYHHGCWGSTREHNVPSVVLSSFSHEMCLAFWQIMHSVSEKWTITSRTSSMVQFQYVHFALYPPLFIQSLAHSECCQSLGNTNGGTFALSNVQYVFIRWARCVCFCTVDVWVDAFAHSVYSSFASVNAGLCSIQPHKK